MHPILIWFHPPASALERLLDHGDTPEDTSDDESLELDALDGLRGEDVFSVVIDAAGGKWIAAYGAEGGLSYLDDGQTPFDRHDDAWKSFVDAV